MTQADSSEYLYSPQSKHDVVLESLARRLSPNSREDSLSVMSEIEAYCLVNATKLAESLYAIRTKMDPEASKYEGLDYGTVGDGFFNGMIVGIRTLDTELDDRFVRDAVVVIGEILDDSAIDDWLRSRFFHERGELGYRGLSQLSKDTLVKFETSLVERGKSVKMAEQGFGYAYYVYSEVIRRRDNKRARLAIASAVRAMDKVEEGSLPGWVNPIDGLIREIQEESQPN